MTFKSYVCFKNDRLNIPWNEITTRVYKFNARAKKSRGDALINIHEGSLLDWVWVVLMHSLDNHAGHTSWMRRVRLFPLIQSSTNWFWKVLSPCSRLVARREATHSYNIRPSIICYTVAGSRSQSELTEVGVHPGLIACQSPDLHKETDNPSYSHLWTVLSNGPTCKAEGPNFTLLQAPPSWAGMSRRPSQLHPSAHS